MSSTAILRIGKYNYACGLFWQIFASANALRQESVKIAEEMQCSHWVVRKAHGIVQAGFSDEKKLPARTRSLAYELAEKISSAGVDVNGERSMPQNWIGIFSLPGYEDRWAYVAVRNNAIMGDGDMLADFDTIVEKIDADGGMMWDVLITDDPSSRHFAQFFSGIPHAIFDSLSVLEKPIGGGRFLQPVKVNPVLKFAKIGLVLAVAFGGTKGYQFYQNYQIEKAAEAARLEAEAKAASVKVVPPWYDKPLPRAAVAACMSSFSDVAPGGWTLTSFVCDFDTNVATTTFAADGMPIWSLSAVKGDAVVANNQASVQSPISIVANAAEQHESLIDRKSATKLFNDLLWRLDIVSDLQEQTPVAKALPGDDAAPPPPAWQELRFAFDTQMLSPKSIVSAISMPGVRLSKIIYEKDTWKLEGVVYAN